MRILSLNKWKLAGYWPNTAKFRKSIETGKTLDAVTIEMDAEVPGSVYKDLLRNGFIKDPLMDQNSLECEWVANRSWVYQTGFYVDPVYRGKNIFLHFKGIDYRASFFLNGKQIGSHTGMFRPANLNITDLISYEDKNIISVVLDKPPEEYGQIGFTSETRTQKSRFNYKWDFSTRLVNVGLYDEAYIACYGAARLTYAKITPVLNENRWRVHLEFELERFQENFVMLEAVLYDGNRAVKIFKTEQIKSGSVSGAIVLDDFEPELWWTNGYGKQPLYRLEVTVYDSDGVSDTKSYMVGFRSLEYKRPDSKFIGDILPYSVVILRKTLR